MVCNSLFGFSVQFHLAALTQGDWKGTAQSLSGCAPLLVSLKQCWVIKGWRGAQSCLIGVGKVGWKSITALKSENIDVSPPGRQGCGTLGAVMASLLCADGGSRHSSAA